MNTIITLLFSATLASGDPGSMVPLTPTEAANLGLDINHDGLLLRNTAFGTVSQELLAKEIAGTTQSVTFSAREQRGASNDVFLNETADGRWCELGSGNAFGDIALNLQSDALITSIRIWGYDESDSNNMTVSLIERCTPNNTSGSVITSVIAEITPPANSGNFTQVTAIGANNTVDNDACSYTLRTRYSTPGNINFCAGNTLRLQKVRLGINPP